MLALVLDSLRAIVRCLAWRFATTAAMALLVVVRTSSAAPPAFTPFHANGIYAVGERVGWTLVAPDGCPTPAGGYRYTIRKNNADTIGAGTLDPAGGATTIETSLAEPGMVFVQVDTGDAHSVTLGAAVAPTSLAPSAPRPADFDAFWDSKLAALRAVPFNPLLRPLDTADAGVSLFAISIGSLGSRVQGYLATPKREGKFPALIIYQYAGVYALQTRTVTDRAAEGWLTLDVSSHDLPPDQGIGVPQNYGAVGNTDRETSYFLKMYLRDARAIDYIASRPDWDGKTIVVMGTSMGGHQSLVAAGLNPKVTAVLVNEPAGADANGDLHGRKQGYPNWAAATDPRVAKTGLYFDTIYFASRIKAPSLVAIGFIDTVTPPVGIWTAFNQIPGPKEAVPMVESDHNNLTPQKQGAWIARSKDVLDTLLHGGPFQPRD